MKRLTEKYRGDSRYYMACAETCGSDMDCMDCPIHDHLVDRLASYEDMGLTPENCAEYKKFEDEIIASGKTFGRLIELLNADKAGRLVALPCKVGDTIYHIDKVRTSHFEDDKIIIDDEGRWEIYEMPFALIHLPYIGKSYFLTREEAEKALEDMQ